MANVKFFFSFVPFSLFFVISLSSFIQPFLSSVLAYLSFAHTPSPGVPLNRKNSFQLFSYPTIKVILCLYWLKLTAPFSYQKRTWRHVIHIKICRILILCLGYLRSIPPPPPPPPTCTFLRALMKNGALLQYHEPHTIELQVIHLATCKINTVHTIRSIGAYVYKFTNSMVFDSWNLINIWNKKSLIGRKILITCESIHMPAFSLI